MPPYIPPHRRNGNFVAEQNEAGDAALPGTAALENGTTFSLFPRSKFAARGLTADDGTVREVGFFSLYAGGDDAAGHGSVEIRDDRSLMRSLRVECLLEEATSVPGGFDLSTPFDDPGQGIFFHPLHVLAEWVARHRKDPNIVDVRDKIKIVSTCMLMSSLLKIAQADCRNSKGVTQWIFGAAKFRGRFSSVRGTRFQEFVTEKMHDPVNSTASGFQQISRSTTFRSVLHTKLRDIDLLILGSMDGENPFVSENTTYPCRYMDVVTMGAEIFHPGNEWKLYGERMQRWWILNVLKGVG
ncbi:hypothetical protein BV898_18282 [Hypsibius exemplaris]|uniref:Uncharacterized protein n=1 Tax=Hypsibius exemplaris TaxID=2072580 RepID=A0A9X6NGY1_HYPEX|nr:hypothetical protein BV898_18282 [Hypsibius exemplaris]